MPHKVTREEKLVPLMERMLELHGSSPRTPGDKERVKRVPERSSGIEKIENTDKAIDRLVYELYGLAEEEIKIVEA